MAAALLIMLLAAAAAAATCMGQVQAVTNPAARDVGRKLIYVVIL